MNTITSVLFGVFMLCISIYSLIDSTKELTPQELYTVTDVITNEAKIIKGSKGSRYINISLQSYPSFSFRIEGHSYTSTDRNLYKSNVKIGDTLYVDVKKDEYQKKITKEKPLDFISKYINYKSIAVYGLRDKNNNYMQLSIYNKERKSDDMVGFWGFLILSVFFLGSVYYNKKYK